ncbi:hypothetical protein [Nitrosomonas ureae]|nr:hypothetical protein [Nitrosomonas ureae]
MSSNIGHEGISIGPKINLDNSENLDTQLTVSIDASKGIPATLNLVRGYVSYEGEIDLSSHNMSGQLETGINVGVELGKWDITLGKIGINIGTQFGITMQLFGYQGSLRCSESKHESTSNDDLHDPKSWKPHDKSAEDFDKAERKRNIA